MCFKHTSYLNGLSAQLVKDYILRPVSFILMYVMTRNILF